MPDITMCKDHECWLRHKCYRYMAVSSPRQAYFSGTPYTENKLCQYYWPINENEDVKGER